MLRFNSHWTVLAVVAWLGTNAIAWRALERYELIKAAAGAGVAVKVVDAYEDRCVEICQTHEKHHRTAHYRLLRPTRLKANERLPVLLFLHGSGQRGSDNLRQLAGFPTELITPAVRNQLRCFVVVPQCPRERTWGSPADGEGCDQLKMAMAAVDDVIRTEPADPSRLYLVGYSMGGFGAWALAARHSERFAAVVPIAGGGNVEWARKLASVPVRVVHGDKDYVVPVERSREMVKALQVAGGRPLFDELSGVSHDSWKAGFVQSQPLIGWLLRQRLRP